jgi:hypothetical protein
VKGNVVIKYGRTNVTDDVIGLPIRIQVAIEVSAGYYLIFLHYVIQQNVNYKRTEGSIVLKQEGETTSSFFN